MSAGAIAIAVLVFILLGAPVTVLILRDEQRKRREWRPEGYRAGTDSPAVVGDWWSRPLRPVGVRQSMVLAGEPSPVVLVEERDPRIVTGNGRREWKKPTGHQRKAVSA